MSWQDKTVSTQRELNVGAGWTQGQRLLFYPIEAYTPNYNEDIPEALELVKAVYPISPDLIKRSSIRPQPFSLVGFPPGTRNRAGLLVLMGDLWLLGHFLDPSATRVVGITPSGIVADFMCFNLPFTECDHAAGAAHGNIPYVVLVEDGHGLQIFTQEVAHELGHTWGHPDHEGAFTTDGKPVWVYGGFWPSRKQRMNHNDSRPGKKSAILHIMSGGIEPEDIPNDRYLNAWYTKDTYHRFLNAAISSSQVIPTQSQNASLYSTNGGSILVSGLIYADGHIQLNPWYRLPEPPTDLPLNNGNYFVEVQGISETVLYSSSFYVDFTFNDVAMDIAPFAFSIPDFGNIASVIMGRDETVVAQRSVSSHFPSITIVSPQPGQQMAVGDMVRWSASDADGDSLIYSVLISGDGGATWEPLRLNTSQNEFILDRTLPSSDRYPLN